MNRMKIAAAVASVALLVSGCTYGRDDASKETALESSTEWTILCRPAATRFRAKISP